MKMITLEEVLQLPVPERIHIVEAVWDSIADSSEVLELSADQKAELDQRLAAIESDPMAEESWNVVRACVGDIR